MNTALLDLLRPGPGERWAAFPSLADARHVVPLTRRAGAAAVRERSRDRGRAGRAASHALAAALGAGAAAPLLRSRTIVGDDHAHSGPSLTAWLEHLLGQDDLAVAVGLGPPRANRKPVLHVLDRDGRTVCFGKVGWDALSRRLVANEAAFLAGAAGRRGETVDVPELIAVAAWQGLEVVLSRPLPLSRSVRRHRLPISAALLRDVAGPLTTVEGWARSVAARARPDVYAALAPTVDRVASSDLPAGRWHGDLTPWNAQADGERFLVWDWERTATPVPLGLDAIHAAYQVASLRGGLDAAASAAAARREAAPVLAALGIGPLELVVDAYLVELFLRHHADGLDVASIAAVLVRSEGA